MCLPGSLMNACMVLVATMVRAKPKAVTADDTAEIDDRAALVADAYDHSCRVGTRNGQQALQGFLITPFSDAFGVIASCLEVAQHSPDVSSVIAARASPEIVDGSHCVDWRPPCARPMGISIAVEVQSRVGQQEAQLGPSGFDGLADRGAACVRTVSSTTISPGRRLGSQHLLDISLEGVAVHGAFEDHGCGHAGRGGGTGDGRRLPLPVRHGARGGAAPAPAAGGGSPRGGAGRSAGLSWSRRRSRR